MPQGFAPPFSSLCIKKDVLRLIVGDICHLLANSFFGSLVSFSVLWCPILPQSFLLSDLLVI